MKTILVPLDGSALAEQALPYARLLAPLLGARVRLLRVVGYDEVDGLVAGEAALQPEPGGDELRGFLRGRAARELLARHAEEYLGRCADELAPAGVEVTSDVRFGSPAAEIQAAARELGEVLLILTPHDYDGTLGPPSSAVLDATLKAASAPVLVVRGATVALADARVPGLRCLLVPIDTPSSARGALDWALRLAGASRAEVLLLHADLAAAHDSAVNHERHRQLAEELGALAADASARRGVPVQALEASGLTHEAILEAAAEHGADLIVMGVQRRGWLERQLFGSVSNEVRRATLVPLLIIPEQT